MLPCTNRSLCVAWLQPFGGRAQRIRTNRSETDILFLPSPRVLQECPNTPGTTRRLQLRPAVSQTLRTRRKILRCKSVALNRRIGLVAVEGVDASFQMEEG